MTVSPALRSRLLLALLLLATVALYAPNLGHPFLYDDDSKIVNNYQLGNPLSYFQAFRSKGYSEETTRLVPNLTFCLNYALFRWEPTGWNATNLLIHLVNIWLVARLGRVVLRRMGRKERFIPLLGAALFAVHTLNTEAVNYCNARPNTLVTLFYLSALLGFVRAVESDGLHVRRWAFFVAALLAALFSKEFAVTLVVMAPLLLFWIGGERYRGFLSRLLLVYGGVGISGLAVVFLTGAGAGLLSILEVGNTLTGHWITYLGCNALNQSQILMTYFGLAFLPLPRYLNGDHEIRHLHELLYPQGGALVANWAEIAVAPALWLVVAVALVVAVFAWRRRAPFATFFLLWPILTHVPTSLVPRGEAMVEYRTYLPMVGVCLFLAWAVDALLRAWRLPRPAILRGSAALALLAALAVGTLVRNRVWRTPTDFWRDVTAKSPNRYRAWNNYGKALSEPDRLDETPEARRRREDEALAAYDRALGIQPGAWTVHNNKGLLMAHRGELDRALEQLTLAIQFGSTSPFTHMNLAAVHEWSGRSVEMVAVLREAVERYPQFVPARFCLGHAHLMQGHPKEAAELLEQVLREAPSMAKARPILADGYHQLKRYDDAARLLEEFLREVPDDFLRRMGLGRLYQNELKDPARAEPHLRRAVALRPDDPLSVEVRKQMGWR